MKIVIAMDSFKGSLTSLEAGEAAAKGVTDSLPDSEIILMPLADGGEGTVSAIVNALGGEMVPAVVRGPLGTLIESSYGMVCAADDTGTSRVTALIEAADAAGLTKVPSSLRNPRKTTTAGLGDLIRHAVTRGIKDFVIGIGGSATNDCGLGMMESLGARFFDEAGELVGGTGDDVKQVTRADLTELLKLTAGCRFRVACDVTNPLCGENGCSLVFGPQKGGTPDMLSAADRNRDGDRESRRSAGSRRGWRPWVRVPDSAWRGTCFRHGPRPSDDRRVEKPLRRRSLYHGRGAA